MYQQSQLGECGKADEFLNSVLSVTDICLAPASAPNAETGGTDHWIRCVLILADGGMVSFGSQGIMKSLSLYCDYGPPPPWKPPVEFKLKSQPIGKNRWYTLEAVEFAPAPLPKFTTGKSGK